MAMSLDPVFPQAPFSKSVLVSTASVWASSLNVTNKVEILSQANNPNGFLLSALTCMPLATNAANVARLYISYDNGTNVYLRRAKSIASDTTGPTDAGAEIDFGWTWDAPLPLPPGASLFVAIDVTQNWNFTIEGRPM